MTETSRNSSGLSPRRGGLLTTSFLALLFTQLLTATNDNIFRWLVIGVGKDFVDPEQFTVVLTATLVTELAPEHAGTIADNLARLEQAFEQLDRDIRAQLAAAAGKRFLVFHPAWGYFAEAYGLQQLAIE